MILYKTILNRTYEQLLALPNDLRVVMIHPAFHGCRPKLLGLILQEQASLYVNLSSTNGSLAAFQHAIAEAWQDQYELTLPSSGQDWAQSLAQALMTHDLSNLILDDYDHIQDAEIHELIVQLAQNLKAPVRILLFSRIFQFRFLGEDVAPLATLVPHLPEELLVDYIKTIPDTNILEVSALGPSQTLMQGRSLDSWDGALPKSLFYYLVDHAMATRNDIFSTFWPQLNKREATNVFHVTKRKINEILGEDLTTYSSGFYHLANRFQLYYDVVKFQEYVQHAEIADTDEEAIALYEEALHLYRGPFLSTLDVPWVIQRREELQLIYIETLTELGHLYLKQGKNESALGVFLRAYAITPHREDLARLIMMTYHHIGQVEAALTVYGELVVCLDQRFQVKPSAETAELAAQIQASSMG